MNHDDFEFIKEIGKGGQGVTWQARHLPTNDIVAVKILAFDHAEDWKAIELFEREAQVLKSINHPNVPSYLGFWTGEVEGKVSMHIAQEYVEGPTLKQELHIEGAWIEDKAQRDLKQMLETLEYLHKRIPPLIHRDIKPANIIRREDGRLCLVDFGAVKDNQSNTVGSSTMVGTPGYMPMEQMIGQASPKSDLYSLGVTFAYLMTGVDPSHIPLRNNQLQFIDKIVHEHTNHLAPVIEHLTQPSQEDRPNSATAVLNMLQHGARHTDHGDDGTPDLPSFTLPTYVPTHIETRIQDQDVFIQRAKRVGKTPSFLGAYFTRCLVVDRAKPKDLSKLKEIDLTGFSYIGAQSRWAFPAVTTFHVWTTTQPDVYMTWDTDQSTPSFVTVFDDGHIVSLKRDQSESNSIQKTELKGTGQFKTDLFMMREYIEKYPATPLTGLDMDRFMMLQNADWFRLPAPVIAPEEEKEKDSIMTMIIVFTILLPVVILLVALGLLAAAVILPLYFVFGSLGSLIEWFSEYQPEREFLPQATGLRPLMTVPDIQPDGQETTFDFENIEQTPQETQEKIEVRKSW